MPKYLLELPLQLEALPAWTSWDQSLAFATIVPRLLAPASARRRGRIRTLFYLSLLEVAKTNADGRAKEVDVFLAEYFNRRRGAILGTSTMTSYRKRLFLGTTRGTCIRQILTVGLTARVMASDDGVEDNARVLATAQAYVCNNYKTGLAVAGDAFSTRQAWFTWKHVAHFCAAFVDFVQEQRRGPIVDDETLSVLERNMDRFCRTTLHHQLFLTGRNIIGGVEIPQRTRKSFGLALLPDLLLTASPYAEQALPTWDKRPLAS